MLQLQGLEQDALTFLQLGVVGDQEDALFGQTVNLENPKLGKILLKYQEKLEKQKKDILSYQTCGIDNIPTCKNNFNFSSNPY